MDPSPFVQHFENLIALAGTLLTVLLDFALWFQAPRAVLWNLSPVLGLLPAVTVVLWCSRRAKSL